MCRMAGPRSVATVTDLKGREVIVQVPMHAAMNVHQIVVVTRKVDAKVAGAVKVGQKADVLS